MKHNISLSENYLEITEEFSGTGGGGIGNRRLANYGTVATGIRPIT
jgi:hypothetical protein